MHGNKWEIEGDSRRLESHCNLLKPQTKPNKSDSHPTQPTTFSHFSKRPHPLAAEGTCQTGSSEPMRIHLATATHTDLAGGLKAELPTHG